jgi:hypothetical protein
MRKRSLSLSAVIALLAAGCFSYLAIGQHLYASYHHANATYQFAPAGSCGALIAWSPPAVLYAGLYINQRELVTVRYSSSTPQTLRISVSVPRFTQEQTIQVQAAKAFQSQSFKPPLFDSTVLDSLVSPDRRDAQLHLRVETQNDTVCDTTAPMVLMSRQWIHWTTGVAGDNAALLAGWVTPQAPAVIDLVGRTDDWIAHHASAYGGITALRGYDGGRASTQDVREQVNALFDTLRGDYHLHYASDNVVFGRDQRIQLPQDVLRNPSPSGMCVETTVILASAIERIGMRSFIVLVPGHAFLGVALGLNPAAPISYWETSYLDVNSASQANVNGEDEYNRFASQDAVRVIDISYERSVGVEPME